MATNEESIYGNQVIIEKHAGDPKPQKVCRPDGLGQESNEPFEESVYVNRDINESIVVKTAKTHHGRSSYVRNSNYEVLSGREAMDAPRRDVFFDHSNEQSPQLYEGFDEDRSIVSAAQNQARWDERNFTKAVTDRAIHSRGHGAKTQRQEETIELQKVESHVPVTTSIPPETREKVAIMEAHRSVVFIGAFAMFLALTALVIALLFGLKVIKVDEECNCERDDTALQVQIDKLQKEVIELKRNVYPSRSGILRSSFISSTAPQNSYLQPTATPGLLASQVVATQSVGASSSTSSVTQHISSLLTSSSSATLFSSSVSKSSEVLHSTSAL